MRLFILLFSFLISFPLLAEEVLVEGSESSSSSVSVPDVAPALAPTSSVHASSVPEKLAPPKSAPVFKEPFSGDAISQLVIGLVIVVGLILLLSWFLRRFSGITPLAKNMRVIGALPLGSREKAVLIQVGDKQVLLGVAPGRVSHIESFDEPVVNTDKPVAFSSRLSEAIQKRGNING